MALSFLGFTSRMNLMAHPDRIEFFLPLVLKNIKYANDLKVECE